MVSSRIAWIWRVWMAVNATATRKLIAPNAWSV